GAGGLQPVARRLAGAATGRAEWCRLAVAGLPGAAGEPRRVSGLLLAAARGEAEPGVDLRLRQSGGGPAARLPDPRRTPEPVRRSGLRGDPGGGFDDYLRAALSLRRAGETRGLRPPYGADPATPVVR